MTRQIEHEANITNDVRANAVEPFWKTVHAPDEDKRPGLRKPVMSAAIAVLLGFGGFLVWGFTANLDSAAIARGKVIADSKTKPISHLEGGILKRLLVQEGDFVEAGQPLIELDATRARAELQQLHGKRISLLATLARLRAERDRKDTVEMPAELAEINSPMAEDVMEAERRLFQKNAVRSTRES
ncbi:biotin/lipoyl-binding protein [Roseibium salinum]|nr:biotin/lipoyl-binding protein [Roseibium salinum]